MRLSRKSAGFVLLGAGAYLAALIATVPADAVLPRSVMVERYGGTLWHGAAALPGGIRIGWDWRPLRSLMNLGFAADWRATGGDTDLGGRALVAPGIVRLEELRGRGDGTLIAALAPDLPFTCALTYRLDVPLVAIGGALTAISGEMRSEAGSCRAKAGGGDIPVVPLVAIGERFAETARIAIAPQARRRTRLVDITTGGDQLDIAITPAGARALPFAAPAGPVTMAIEL